MWRGIYGVDFGSNTSPASGYYYDNNKKKNIILYLYNDFEPSLSLPQLFYIHWCWTMVYNYNT